METITSRDNAKIKYACAVRDSEKQRAADGLFFAGQITGFEGYMESAASGLLAARQIYARLQGRELPRCV